MNDELLDSALRTAAFDHVRRLVEIHGALDAKQIRAGFQFKGERIPLVNPQRGIFKPQRMQRLLSIRTVYPKPGGKVWYDDQREVHREFFESDETINYAFMGAVRFRAFPKYALSTLPISSRTNIPNSASRSFRTGSHSQKSITQHSMLT